MRCSPCSLTPTPSQSSARCRYSHSSCYSAPRISTLHSSATRNRALSCLRHPVNLHMCARCTPLCVLNARSAAVTHAERCRNVLGLRRLLAYLLLTICCVLRRCCQGAICMVDASFTFLLRFPQWVPAVLPCAAIAVAVRMPCSFSHTKRELCVKSCIKMNTAMCSSGRARLRWPCLGWLAVKGVGCSSQHMQLVCGWT